MSYDSESTSQLALYPTYTSVDKHATSVREIARSSSSSSQIMLAEPQKRPPVLSYAARGCGHLILNQPSRLNAMNYEMAKLFLSHLQAYEKSDHIKLIIVKGQGRALCAGGDVRDIMSLVSNNDLKGFLTTLETIYQTMQYVATMKKPYLSLMDGITMGGGAGISVHGAFKIATENTRFAMPETAIGFFPDVGSSFFLPRMDGQLGLYLAMTGQTIKAQDVLLVGMATHYVPSAHLPALERCLANIKKPTHDNINEMLDRFCASIGPVKPEFTLRGDIRRTIDKCFKHDTVEEIFEALQADGSPFALETYTILSKRSPTSIKVTLEEMRRGCKLGVTQCLQMEFRLLQKVMFHHDFKEGITSHLISKRQPCWNPPTLQATPNVCSEFFDSPVRAQLTPLRNADYLEHPFRRFTLPSEEDVRRYIADTPRVSQAAVVNHFVKACKHKFGVLEKVTDILDRKTRVTRHGLDWVE